MRVDCDTMIAIFCLLTYSLSLLRCCSPLLVLALLCSLLFSLYLLFFFFVFQNALPLLSSSLALSLLTLKVLAKLFDCVDYFASLFVFYASSTHSSSSSPFIFFHIVLVHIVNIL